MHRHNIHLIDRALRLPEMEETEGSDSASQPPPTLPAATAGDPTSPSAVPMPHYGVAYNPLGAPPPASYPRSAGVPMPPAKYNPYNTLGTPPAAPSAAAYNPAGHGVPPPVAYNPVGVPPAAYNPGVAAYNPQGTPPGAYPGFAPPQIPMLNNWSTGLFDCMDDVENCFITLWCPCITFGRIAEIVDRGSTSCAAMGGIYATILYFSCLQWIFSFTYRTKLRAQYNLVETPFCDCGVHYCCEPCALCQEYRELKNRGFDMNLGWQMNAQRMGLAVQPAMMQPPMMQPGMMR